MLQTVANPSWASQQAEMATIQKYRSLADSHYFVPLAVETSDIFGPHAFSFLSEEVVEAEVDEDEVVIGDELVKEVAEDELVEEVVEDELVEEMVEDELVEEVVEVELVEEVVEDELVEKKVVAGGNVEGEVIERDGKLEDFIYEWYF